MSAAWYWPDWQVTNPDCTNPPGESCADAGCPVHGGDDAPPAAAAHPDSLTDPALD